MKDTVSPGLLESFSGGVHGLSGSGESACSQRFDVLHVTYFGTGVDDFLVSFEKFLGKLAELKNFSFNERIA